MKSELLFVLVIVTILFPTAALQAQRVVSEMTPAIIVEAIKVGERGDVPSGALTQSSGFSWGSVHVATFSTPFMRVAAAARQAKKEYRKFSAEDVTPEMTAPELHIYAWPQAFGKPPSNVGTGTVYDRNSGTPWAANVSAVVITPRKGKDEDKQAKAIQPTRIEDIPIAFQNLFGAKSDGVGRMAVFPLSVLSEENEVHVVYDREVTIGTNAAGGRHCQDCRAAFKLKGVR